MDYIKEVSEITKGMEKDNFFGTMESIIQGNGMKAQKMGKVIGNQLQEKAIWANG